MNADVYVSFLDVLGFKDLVYNNSHESLVGKYQNLFALNAELSLSNGAFTVIEQHGNRVAVADRTKINVNSLVISDSIILWTNNASMKSFIDVVVATRNLLIQGIFVGLPLRGGIALGPLSRLSYKLDARTDNAIETFIGRGLVDACQTESSQQWSGCVIGATALARYEEQYHEHSATQDNLASVDHLVQSGLIVEYAVPMQGGRETHTVINWPRGNQSPPTEDTVRKSFGMHNKTVAHPSVTLKIENTVQFLHAMLR